MCVYVRLRRQYVLRLARRDHIGLRTNYALVLSELFQTLYSWSRFIQDFLNKHLNSNYKQLTSTIELCSHWWNSLK